MKAKNIAIPIPELAFRGPDEAEQKKTRGLFENIRDWEV
jgi:hypothetical protein